MAKQFFTNFDDIDNDIDGDINIELQLSQDNITYIDDENNDKHKYTQKKSTPIKKFSLSQLSPDNANASDKNETNINFNMPVSLHEKESKTKKDVVSQTAQCMFILYNF